MPRVSMSYAYQGVSGKQVLHPGFPGLHCTPFPYKSHMLKRLQQIPGIQWVAWRTVHVTRAEAVPHVQYTVSVATRWQVLPIPVHVGG
jgi:hypothetical protein